MPTRKIRTVFVEFSIPIHKKNKNKRKFKNLDGLAQHFMKKTGIRRVNMITS